MFGDEGCGFGVEAVDGGVVGIKEADGNVPVARVIGGVVQPEFDIGEQAFFFQRFIDRLEVLANILPEGFSLTRLDVVVGDAPDRADIVVGTLRIAGQRGQQHDHKECGPQNFSHGFSSDYRRMDLARDRP